MDNKNNEHIDEAVRLWHSAFIALNGKNIPAYLECAMRFHEHMSSEKLLNDKHVMADIKIRTKNFEDETYLYRIPTVMSYLSRGSADGADIMTQVSTLKMLNSQFLEYSTQDKFNSANAKTTVDLDKGIARDILLYCAMEKVKKQIINHVKDPEMITALLKKLSTLKNCDVVVDFYKRHLNFNMNAKVLSELENIAHKAFIVENTNYSGADKLLDNDTFNSAIASENESFLRETRTTVEKEYLGRFSKMSEDDQLTTAASIIDQRQLHGESPNQSPRKTTEFVQSVVYELLRNSGFKITAKMQELPTQTLVTIKEAVDHQLEKTPRPNRNSVVSIARSHLSGEAKQRKSLDLATRKLDTAISRSPPPASNNSPPETLKSSK